VLALARNDPRVVAGALLASLTQGGDRWSDLDLTFGVDGDVAPVPADFTRAAIAALLREAAGPVEPQLRELAR